MDKPIKVLLILVHSTQNAGDLALLQISLNYLGKYFKNASFTISANYPEEIWYKENDCKAVPSPISIIVKSKNTPPWLQLLNFILSLVITVMFFLKIRFLVPRKWNLLLREYESSNLIVAVPGNQIFSTGRFGWPFPVSIYSIVLAHLFRKPFYVLPQSIGPFRWWWEKLLIRFAYSKAKLIFLRDQVSLEIAQQIGLPVDKVFFAPDPAIALEPSTKETARDILCKYGWNQEKSSVGITIIAPMGHFLDQLVLESYYSELASAIVRFSSKWDLQVVFFTQVSGPTEVENDRIPTLSIFKKVYSQVKAIYVDEVLSPEKLKACYGEMDIFLASRLHSGIFSISMGVPTVFIGYLTKTVGFLRAIGLEKYGLNLNGMDENILLKVLDEVWLSKSEISFTLFELTNCLLSKIELTFNTIYSGFSNERKN